MSAMARDKYISVKSGVNGFSFANLGLFTGFADGIYNAVYSLVLMEIFANSAVVGVYVAIYAAFCMIVGLFANEIFRRFSKVRVFFAATLFLAAGYAMMSFSVRTSTFVMLDYATGVAVTLVGILIPLFMSDFSGRVGMARLNSRYHLWMNVGALFAPTIAVAIANQFDNRAAFFAAALIYFACWMAFNLFRVAQSDKKITPVNPRRTLRALIKNAVAFFKTRGMARAYAVNFGYYALRAMRYLYVPIVVIENGFSKDTLGWVLTLGIVPYLILSDAMAHFVYLILSDAMAHFVRKDGKKKWLMLGFVSFAVMSVLATFATGFPLLIIFVAWQVSGALMESVHDLLFFDGTTRAAQTKFYGVFRTSVNLTKFYGVFRTSVNLPNIIAPLLAAMCITAFGGTSAVWIVTAVIGAISAALVVAKK